MKKLIGIFLCALAFNVYADHTVTHAVDQAVERGDIKPEELDYCKKKAKMGKDIRTHRDDVTLEYQLKDLKITLATMERKLPRFIELEMERVIRDAYRSYRDPDGYYTHVYEECLVSGY